MCKHPQVWTMPAWTGMFQNFRSNIPVTSAPRLQPSRQIVPHIQQKYLKSIVFLGLKYFEVVCGKNILRSSAWSNVIASLETNLLQEPTLERDEFQVMKRERQRQRQRPRPRVACHAPQSCYVDILKTMELTLQESFSERKFEGHGNAVAFWQCQVLTRCWHWRLTE